MAQLKMAQLKMAQLKMARLTHRVLSVDVGERNLGMAIWDVVKSQDGPSIKLSYLACHDVLQAVGCTAKCRSVTKVDSVRHMCTFLARNQAQWAPDTITDFVVEGQVRASPKNQCLTAALFAWFSLVSAGRSPQPRMASICAKNKVKSEGDGGAVTNQAVTGNSKATSPTPSIDKNSEKGKSKAAKKGVEYRQRKKGAVTCLADLISSRAITVEASPGAQPDVLAQWRGAKKKDDMADAALQGLWYIENKLKMKRS